jgi:TPR repeat protein
LISSRDTYPALAESETMMSLLGDSDSYENARERWEADRYRRKKWSIAAKMMVIALVALVATASAMAVRLVFFEKSRPLADVTAPQIVVPRQTATETVPAVARQSAEALPASAEQNGPRNPANGLNSGLTPDDAAADTKSVGRGQDAPPQAPAAKQSPARLLDKGELAGLLKRGRYLLSIGDIAPARLLLERAADAHDASAAFDLAGTYDPAVLTRSHLSGIAPDLAMARMWYEKALSLGHPEAQQRLAQLKK